MKEFPPHVLHQAIKDHVEPTLEGGLPANVRDGIAEGIQNAVQQQQAQQNNRGR